MFPPLPAAPNGALSALGALAGRGASTYNSLQNRLQAAAQQKATLEREKANDARATAQQGLATDLEMAKLGATRSPGPSPNRPTLAQRGPDTQADASPGGQIIQDPRGGSWNVPDQRKSFVPAGQLGELLKTGGWDGTTPITQEQSHSLMQAINEAAPKDEPFDIDTSGKFLDAQGKPAAVTVGRKTGKVRPLDLSGGGNSPNGASPFQTSEAQKQGPIAPGTQIGGGAPGGAFSFAPPEKKAGTQSLLPGQVGPHGGPLMVDHDTGMMKEVLPIPGSRQTMTAAQTEADKDRDTARVNRREDQAAAASLREENRQQGGRDRAQTQIDIFNTRETEQNELIKAYGKVLSQPNTVSKESDKKPVFVIDPKTGREVPMTEARRAEFQSAFERATSLRDNWHGQAVKLIQRHGGDTGETPQTPKADSPKTPGRGGAQTVKTAPVKPAQPTAAPAAKPAVAVGAKPAAAGRTAPPAAVTQGLKPGTHTFGNGQTWSKGADGSMKYVSGGQ